MRTLAFCNGVSLEERKFVNPGGAGVTINWVVNNTKSLKEKVFQDLDQARAFFDQEVAKNQA